MEIVTSPQALPGSCYVCGSGSRERYVDFNTDVEFHGAFYLCDVCVTECATGLGMITSEKATQIVIDSKEMESKLEKLNKEVIALREANRALATANSVVDRDSRIGGDLLSLTPITDEQPSGGKDNVGEGEGTTSESVHDEGMVELHSNVVDDAAGTTVS